MLDNLKRYKIILASKSPRRRELLTLLQIPFKVVTIGDIPENYPPTLPAAEVPEYLSHVKADAYISHLDDDNLVITADTIVICDGEILGKPTDSEDAIHMLRKLSGRTHEVVTGVTTATKEQQKSFSVETVVKFAEISDDDIRYYVDTFHPFDKAGAYGIQEWIGAIAVESIHGSYYNVMGLPVHRLYHELKSF